MKGHKEAHHITQIKSDSSFTSDPVLITDTRARTYCALPPVCVRCGEEHDNRLHGNHPDEPSQYMTSAVANYRGCLEHKKFIKNITSKPRENHKVALYLAKATHPYAILKYNQLARLQKFLQTIESSPIKSRTPLLLKMIVLHD